MCSEFIRGMDNHRGDLTDMLRGIAGDWQFVSNPVNYPSDPSQEFGDPFTQLGDPLLQDRDAPVFQGVENSVLFSGGADVNNGHKYFEHEEMKLKPSNIFSRMLQISPTPAKLQLPPRESIASALAASAASPGGLKGGAMLVPNNIMDHRGLINSPNSSKSCLIENPAGIQIPPPRNTGIKRRKSQSKKVVCIPAPAPVNSRPSGEVVPSDLWAWRKYGQKPIKGSPYPRGYYRCSSSKGCSARRQVERSRTDPNMLVITYTSEHNHPWPTQRNALAGSTRTHQPTKTTTTPKNPQKQTDPKEEPKDTTTQNPTADPIPTVLVKQEKDTSDFEMNDAINAGYRQCYKPVFLESLNIQTGDSFFADLGEIEPDPLDLLFTEGFSGGDDPDNKALDPFTFYDWAGTNGGSATTSIAGESKMDS